MVGSTALLCARTRETVRLRLDVDLCWHEHPAYTTSSLPPPPPLTTPVQEDKGGNPELVRESQRKRDSPVELVDEVIDLFAQHKACE